VIWTPLFENSDNAEEATRNVAAASLGKLAAINPSQYLGQLRAKLHDPTPAVRATVLSAIRYTLADISADYDEQLSPLIPEFLSLMADSDLVRISTWIKDHTDALIDCAAIDIVHLELSCA